MTEQTAQTPPLRETILARPELILEDQEIMRVLLQAHDRALGTNVIDLRGALMERLESRLQRLEDAHEMVLAAAYDNLSGTRQVHRAALALLDPPDFAGLIQTIGGPLTEALGIRAACVLIEAEDATETEAFNDRLGHVLRMVPPGTVAALIAGGEPGAPGRAVVLRRVRAQSAAALYRCDDILSEALIPLAIGPGVRPALLALGAAERGQFSPEQGTDLMEFLGGVLERQLRKWLS